MKTIILNDNPYGGLIQQYFNQEFPRTSVMNNSDKVDLLTNTMIGTKEIRYGCIPNPESLVVIRKTIRESILNNKPIPILVPWGSIKGNFTDSLDIAEVSAINRLVQLSETIEEIYPMGLEIVIRVEDTSGYLLFGFDKDINEVIPIINSYSAQLEQLVEILSPEGTIKVQRESKMENNQSFNEEVHTYLHYFIDYLLESDSMQIDYASQVENMESYITLKSLGWKGIICNEQRNYYYETYKRLYPNENHYNAVKRLALYMCESFVRYKLDMSGKRSYWNDYIQVTFVQPIKGLPEGYHNNCLYYRTLPMSQARTHMCPWRGFGYLQISGNLICAKITSFNNEAITSQIIESKTVISNSEGLNVTINTNYLLID